MMGLRVRLRVLEGGVGVGEDCDERSKKLRESVEEDWGVRLPKVEEKLSRS
jgi:hypothetical protein